MNNNDKCSDDRFEYLLSRAIAKTISSEEEDELWDNYFGTTDVEKSFKYFRTAVERSYVKAYYWLGRAFLLGEGCERSNADALHYLNLSIENGEPGHLELGDCYRLGLGVDKNFDIAWEHYSKADKYRDEETTDGFRLDDLMLRDSRCEIDMEPSGIPAEWWEFVMAKVPDAVSLFAEMTLFYKKNSDRWLYWIQKAAEQGVAWCMREMLDLTQDDAEKEKYITTILDSEYSDANDWVMEEVARTVIKGNFPEELKDKAALILFDNDLITPEDEKDNDFMDHVEGALMLRGDGDDNEFYDEKPFVCACCHERIPIDEIDDPEREFCDDCCYTGRCIEPDDEDDEEDEEE